ncbi:MAG: DUF368 domain-containing protein, partial [Planctomycetales bacterium]|nr:DUF368 domain-containing protein [Planctomycetales bacterium]
MTGDLLNVMRGVAMGCADVVPGVSGGTVALIVGIYERLVRALSHVDGTLLRLVGQRQWRKAAAHLDLRFLCGLAAGVIVGFLVMTLTINAVLKTPGGRPLLLASFFGMIVASSLLVGRMVRPRNRQEKVFCLLLAVLGAMAALWLQRLNPPNPDIAIADLAAVRPSFPFLFLCAT